MNNVSKRRKDDIVIFVVHDKVKNDIMVKYLNDEAIKILKCSPQDILEKSFLDWVDDNTRSVIKDFLKDDSAWKNLEEVITRIAVFHLLDSEKMKIRVKVKVFPKESANNNLLEFELLIRNLSIIDKFTEFKIAHNALSEELNTDLGVLDYDLDISELKISIEFAYKNSVHCTICQINLKEKDELYDLDDDIRSVINILKLQIRESDRIGIRNKKDIIFTLFGCPANKSAEVVERIYNAIKFKLNIKFCITYFPIIAKVSLENVLNSLENTSKMLLK